MIVRDFGISPAEAKEIRSMPTAMRILEKYNELLEDHNSILKSNREQNELLQEEAACKVELLRKLNEATRPQFIDAKQASDECLAKILEYRGFSGTLTSTEKTLDIGQHLSAEAPFFMVYVNGQRGPEYRHDTLEGAKREAERLAIQVVEKAYVLAPITKFAPNVTVSEAPMDDSDKVELPF